MKQRSAKRDGGLKDSSGREELEHRGLLAHPVLEAGIGLDLELHAGRLHASTDFSFYTKRGLLAVVYTSAMLYWLNDECEDSADTEDFIDWRLADVLKLPSLGRAAQDALRKVTAPFDLLRREARR